MKWIILLSLFAFSNAFNPDHYTVTDGELGRSESFVCPTGTLVIPDNLGVTSIGKIAFHECTQLTSVVLPEGLTSIGVYPFFGTRLRSVQLPSSLTSVDSSAFDTELNAYGDVGQLPFTSVKYTGLKPTIGNLPTCDEPSCVEEVCTAGVMDDDECIINFLEWDILGDNGAVTGQGTARCPAPGEELPEDVVHAAMCGRALTSDPTTIWVSAGQRVAPYYTFYTDEGCTAAKTGELAPDTQYMFKRCGDATDHPIAFSTDDGDSYQPSGGIKGDDSYTVDMGTASSLKWKCTTHGNMAGDFCVGTDRDVCGVCGGDGTPEPGHWCENGVETEHGCPEGKGVREEFYNNLPTDSGDICEVCAPSDQEYSNEVDTSMCKQHTKCGENMQPSENPLNANADHSCEACAGTHFKPVTAENPTNYEYCILKLYGCTNPGACNYDASANTDDGSCEYQSCSGCTNPSACNYDNSATIDDGSCEMVCPGCTNPSACNYDNSATEDDGSCTQPPQYYDCDGICVNDSDSDGVCDELEVSGCTDRNACNYDPDATEDDGSCAENDCAGTCGGSAVLSGCDNQCGSTKTVDCAGTCGGSAVRDYCGTCGGHARPNDGYNCDGTCAKGYEYDKFLTCCLEANIDACNVCNGPGAIYDCGCSAKPAGDCDCNGNTLDALGVCGGSCVADVDSDGVCDDVDQCDGRSRESSYCGSFTFDGQIYTENTIIHPAGCTEGFHITINPEITETQTVCGSDTLTWMGIERFYDVADSTTLSDLQATASNGCTATLTLTAGTVDCNGDCGGTAVEDDCGDCGGDGSACASGDTTEDTEDTEDTSAPSTCPDPPPTNAKDYINAQCCKCPSS